ncbi:uncharacterized protein J4E78_002986 [Alternaria triticimaculans]|uniref:uncharacterized protein n=1 Tax=Alternaria triticimaculans TaxID=297637 RepID=UPI0020C45418|nr:uncharacterized protein J4E78_002986 [Alternaria triticimaculans]KAI4665524.1 hypothetical protein J4E78_002986 [Alternaria triticimaculans]
MGKRLRVPNCTHLDMDRVFGQEQHCGVCGRSPSIGFLYECRQDCEPRLLRTLLARDQDSIEPVKSALRQELEKIGLGESIIITAESGHYTDKQLNKLKGLKLELQQVILDTQQATQASDVVSRLTAAMAKAPYSTDGAFNSMPDMNAKPMGCNVRACHTCRPYYRERMYIPFQAVLNAEFPPMTREDMEELPTKSAHIMRTIGTRAQPLPSSTTLGTSPSTLPNSNSFATSAGSPLTASSNTTDSSEATFKTTQTDMDEISAQRRPRRRFYKMGRRSSVDIARSLSRGSSLLTPQGLKSAVQGIFRPNRESSSEGSNITLPLPRTGTVRDNTGSPPVGEFDLGALRRVRKQKERNEVKNGTYTGGFENVTAHATAPSDPASGNNSSTDSEFSVYSFTTEGEEEVVVEGVAITEEAAETHTPDLVALNVPAIHKLEAVIKTAEVATTEIEEDADIGLQSIMTQV